MLLTPSNAQHYNTDRTLLPNENIDPPSKWYSLLIPIKKNMILRRMECN
jgi:hypothetical protein